MTRMRWGVGLSGLVALAVAWRVGGLDGELLGADAHYHLRHLHLAVERFPEVGRWDAGTHFPDGHRSQVAGLLHVALAAVALVLGGGAPSAPLLEAVLAWHPVVLAALTVVLVALLGRRLADPASGLLGAALLVAWPGPWLGRTLLGAGDHHALEALLAVAATLGAVDTAQRGPRAAWRAALPLALAAYAWVGAPLLLVLHGLGWAAAWWLAEGDPRRDLARAAAATGGWLALATLPMLVAPDLVLRPSALPLWLGAVAAHALVPLVADGLARRVGGARGDGLVALLAAAAVLGGLALSPTLREGAGWLVAPRHGAVEEHAAPGLGGLLRTLGPAVALAIVAGVGVRSPRAWLLLLPAGLWTLQWLRVHDHGYTAAPVLAAAGGLALPVLRARLGRVAPVLVGAAVLAAPLVSPPWPTEAERGRGHLRTPAWAGAIAWLRDEAAPQPPAHAIPFRDGVAAWPDGSWGVLTPWSHGSLVAAGSDRPVVWSQGVDPDGQRWLVDPVGPTQPSPCPRCDEEHRARYVVVDVATASDAFLGTWSEAGGDPRELRGARPVTWPGRGPLDAPTWGPAWEQARAVRMLEGPVHGAGDLRWVWASPASAIHGWELRAGPEGDLLVRGRRPAGDGTDLAVAPRIVDGVARYDERLVPEVVVYERVRGARVQVRGVPAGARVTATLNLVSTTRGTEHRWTRETPADEGGLAELRVPYPTASAEHTTVQAAGPLEVTWAGPDGAIVRHKVEIPENAVLEGLPVPAP